jgi:hypothetical protein
MKNLFCFWFLAADVLVRGILNIAAAGDADYGTGMMDSRTTSSSQAQGMCISNYGGSAGTHFGIAAAWRTPTSHARSWLKSGEIPVFALDTPQGFVYSASSVFTGGSSSGRTTGSEPVYGGSNPPPPTSNILIVK